MTRRTWQGDLLQRLGYVNLGADATGDERAPGFASLSDEILAGLAPERVLLVTHGDVNAVRQAFERRMRERGLWRDAASNPLAWVATGGPSGGSYADGSFHYLGFLGSSGRGRSPSAATPLPTPAATPSRATGTPAASRR